MAIINPLEGIKYGFRLMGYVIAVGLIGGIILLIGFVMIDGDNLIVGGLLALVGFLTVYAGMLGMGYKVIADSVHMALVESDLGSSGGQQPRQQPRGGQQQPRGGQQRQPRR